MNTRRSDHVRRPSPGRRRGPSATSGRTWRVAPFWVAVLVASVSLMSTAPSAVRATATGGDDAAITPATAPEGNLVVNGSFEDPDISVEYESASFVSFANGSDAITGWTIDEGSVDLVSAPHWTAADGDQVLDLDGDPTAFPVPDWGNPTPTTRGWLTQNIPTDAETEYLLAFRYAANPDCGSEPATVSAEVYWDGEPLESVVHATADPAPAGPSTYSTYEATVSGSAGSSELQFRSTSSLSSTCGIVLDDVSLVPAPVDPPGPNPWVGSGTGTTTVINDGTDGSPEFSYDHEVECCATGTWEFSTEASEAGTVDLDWTYSGYHAWFQVTAGLTAFVRTEGGDANTPLVSAGPANCCDGPPVGRLQLFRIDPADRAGRRRLRIQDVRQQRRFRRPAERQPQDQRRHAGRHESTDAHRRRSRCRAIMPTSSASSTGRSACPSPSRSRAAIRARTACSGTARRSRAARCRSRPIRTAISASMSRASPPVTRSPSRSWPPPRRPCPTASSAPPTTTTGPRPCR